MCKYEQIHMKIIFSLLRKMSMYIPQGLIYTRVKLNEVIGENDRNILDTFRSLEYPARRLSSSGTIEQGNNC